MTGLLGKRTKFSRATVTDRRGKGTVKKPHALLIFLCQEKPSGFGYLCVGLTAALIRAVPNICCFSEELVGLLQPTFGHTRPG